MRRSCDELDFRFDQDSVPSLPFTEEIALFSETTSFPPLAAESPARKRMKLEAIDHDSVVIHHLRQFQVACDL